MVSAYAQIISHATMDRDDVIHDVTMTSWVMWSRLQDEFEIDMDQQEGNFNAIHPRIKSWNDKIAPQGL